MDRHEREAGPVTTATVIISAPRKMSGTRSALLFALGF
jgi:hypothetical protein